MNDPRPDEIKEEAYTEVPQDLVKRAREFAVVAHARIDHRRKYTNLPYTTHLEHVAALVASVTDDPETIATAWLHDVVEDTTATIEDVEEAFGSKVAALVESLTDVSGPGDGNRAVRKEMDRQHLAGAAKQAKTVKLADLIDNCRDICKNNRRFARVYLKEMSSLLEVLEEGNEELYRQAFSLHNDCSRQLAGRPSREVAPEAGLPDSWNKTIIPDQVIRHYTGSFTSVDVADHLRSFDIESDSVEVRRIMEKDFLEIVCLREKGLVRGYALRNELKTGRCTNHLRTFRAGQVLSVDDPLTEVIRKLTLYEYVFVSLFDEVVAYIHRGCINKSVARMWLFGMITLTELELVRLISEHFPGDRWKQHVSPGRMEKAVAMQQERRRRKQQSSLVECLQFSDKAFIAMEEPTILAMFGFDSKRAAKNAVKHLESLRNNLAHAQDIVTHDWVAIARIASRVEEEALFRRSLRSYSPHAPRRKEIHT